MTCESGIAKRPACCKAYYITLLFVIVVYYILQTTKFRFCRWKSMYLWPASLDVNILLHHLTWRPFFWSSKANFLKSKHLQIPGPTWWGIAAILCTCAVSWVTSLHRHPALLEKGTLFLGFRTLCDTRLLRPGLSALSSRVQAVTIWGKQPIFLSSETEAHYVLRISDL